MDNVSEQYEKKNRIKTSLIKWSFILALVVFAAIMNKDFVASAINEIKKTTYEELLWCIFLGNMYFVIEAMILRLMTKTGEKQLSFFKGLVCAYMCAFYRVSTLGSGNGIAQLYYFNLNGISYSSGTGIALSQYTIQKITIGLFGVISFFGVIAMGDDRIKKYSDYMLMGTVLITLVCLFLLVITVSKTFSKLVIKLGRKLVKNSGKLNSKIDQAEVAVQCLQEQGRKIWMNKLLFVKVCLLNICKFSCWYAIPGILFIKDYDVDFLMCLFLMAVCNMIGCVMAAPSGVGTLEFVFTIFFSAIIPRKKAIAAAIVIYRFFTWIVPFVIGIIPAMLVKKK